MPCAVYDHSCSIYPSDNYSLSVAYISSKCNWVKSMFGRLWLGVSCQATRWSRRTRSHGWMRHLPPSHRRLLLSQSRARTPTAASKGSRPREGWPQQEPTARTRAGHPLRSSRWPRCPGRRHPGTWRWLRLDHEPSETQLELATLTGSQGPRRKREGWWMYWFICSWLVKDVSTAADLALGRSNCCCMMRQAGGETNNCIRCSRVTLVCCTQPPYLVGFCNTHCRRVRACV